MNAESTVRSTNAGVELDLAAGPAMTPQGLVPGIEFFNGFVDRPDVTARGILAVADVAATRYADFGLAQRLASLDPVVTAGGDRLRFESFSACNGVYARLDLLRGGLGSSEIGFGTTNVDVNQPLRSALARMHRAEVLHLSVGPKELQVSSPSATYAEPKVNLPDRWVRGLAETAQMLAGMEPAASLTGTQARQFIAGLPRVAPPGPELHVVPFPTGWRTAARPVPNSIRLPGASRLRGSDRILQHTEKLTVFRHRHGSTAWVFRLPGARFTLALSPGPFRGFSGEGSLLTFLTHPAAEAAGRSLLGELGWSPVVDPAALEQVTGLAPDEVRAGLSWLAASGRLGYDLDEGAWFHRELPIDSEAVLRRNPRIRSAQRLLDTGGVVSGTTDGEWLVRGTDGATYVVTGDARCTCKWQNEHGDSRGPCKHALAVVLLLRS